MSAATAPVLRALGDHMVGIIWTESDMSVREARWWLHLLRPSRLSAVRARSFGFDFIERPADIRAAREGLRRFIRAYGVSA